MKNQVILKVFSFPAIAFALLAASGCAAQDPVGGDGSPNSTDDTTSEKNTIEDTALETDSVTVDDTETQTMTLPSVGCQGIDILFVIDDSPSMEEEQGNLIANFPKFIEVLDTYEPEPGAHINYRLGLTTADVDRSFTVITALPGVPTMSLKQKNTKTANGRFVNGDQCGLSQPWLEGPGPGVTAQFSCVGNVGIQGSGYEMPLSAVELALGEQMQVGGANEGFFQKDENRLLGVVIITDEDDCSVEEGGTIRNDLKTGSDCDPDKSEGLYEIDRVKTFLDELAGGEGRYVVAGIAGPGPNSCTSSFGEAIYAQRLRQFVELVGAYGVFGDICEGNLWTSLEEALSVMKIACQDLAPQ